MKNLRFMKYDVRFENSVSTENRNSYFVNRTSDHHKLDF